MDTLLCPFGKSVLKMFDCIANKPQKKTQKVLTRDLENFTFMAKIFLQLIYGYTVKIFQFLYALRLIHVFWPVLWLTVNPIEALNKLCRPRIQ